MSPEAISEWIAESMAARWEALHKAYRIKRRRWARKIGFPYSGDQIEPDPGVYDLVAEGEG